MVCLLILDIIKAFSKISLWVCIECIIKLGRFILSIVKLVIFILLSAAYFQSNFGDFKDFSKCQYLNKSFNNDYDFVFVVKDNFIKFFVVYLICLFFEIVIFIMEPINIAKQKKDKNPNQNKD